MAETRREHDALGDVDVPMDRIWGAQTQRSLTYFAISTEKMPPLFLQSLAIIKQVCAIVNLQLGQLSEEKVKAILQAADEVIQGKFAAEFPLSIWQTGSGTQSNMNMNEVLANRASQLLGGPVGNGRLVHPNDDVNHGQSSNDIFPTAMNVAISIAIAQQLLPALERLIDTLAHKSSAFSTIVKIGRTHLQDATPLTLGQEISGWHSQLTHAREHIADCLPHIHELAVGGTAVGTGLNTHPTFGARVADLLTKRTGIPFVSAPNKFEALASHDGLVYLHGALKGLACALMKIANDVRWLGSGPRAGLGELQLPENEPGSSIMPGKVNPTQCEALTMVCARVLGNDVAVNVGGMSGQFELNVFKPLILDACLQSIRLLSDSIHSFDEHCMRGLEVRRARVTELLQRSLMLVTALVPHIGYDKAAQIARHAHLENMTLRDSAIASGWLSGEDFDAWVRPEEMTYPHE